MPPLIPTPSHPCGSAGLRAPPNPRMMQHLSGAGSDSPRLSAFTRTIHQPHAMQSHCRSRNGGSEDETAYSIDLCKPLPDKPRRSSALDQEYHPSRHNAGSIMKPSVLPRPPPRSDLANSSKLHKQQKRIAVLTATIAHQRRRAEQVIATYS